MNIIEVLYFDGCPNATIAVDRARQALATTEVSAELYLVRIDSDMDVVRHRFLGSPTVRVNGRDVDDSASARQDFGLRCRVYSVDGRLAGAPPVAWIEAALRDDAGANRIERPTRAGRRA